MTRRSSWFVVVLVLVLLFVSSDCLRRPTTHDEGRDLSTIRSRGNARFSSKAAEGLETTSEPLTTTPRSNRRSNNLSVHNSATASRRRTTATTKAENITEKTNIEFSPNPVKSRNRNPSASNGDLTRAASGDRRYLPDPSSRKKPERANEEIGLLQTPHEVPKSERNQRGSPRNRSPRAELRRRTDFADPVNEASVVIKSRNERKIQTVLSPRDFENSNRYSSGRSSEGFSGPSSNARSVYRTSETGVRHIPEQNIRRHDVDSSYSDHVNIGVLSNTPTTTAPLLQNKELKSRDHLSRKNNDGTVSTSSFSPRNSDRRGASKFAESAAYLDLVNNSESPTTSPKEFNSRSAKKEQRKFQNLQENSGPRNRGRTQISETTENSKLETSRRSFSEKKKLGRGERSSENPKVVKTDRRHFNLSDKYRPRKSRLFPSSSKESPKESISNSVDITTTLPVTTELIEEATEKVISPPQKFTETPGYRRAAASTLAIKTLPKDEGLDEISGFRGRKTIKYSTNTLSNQDNENSSNDIPTNIKKHNRSRGNGVFNKVTITKIDKEIDESDNYPPEFKAKLAQLTNSNKNNEQPESPKFSKDDEVTKILTRHSRSTDRADLLDTLSETDENPDVKPILPEPNILATEEGSKKRTPGTSFSTRSKEKLEDAKKQIKPDLKNEAKVDTDNSSSTTEIPLKYNEESKLLRAPKRYGASKLSTTTPRAAVTVTLPKIDKKLTRTSKSVERGNVRVGETLRVRQNQKERITTTVAPDDEYGQSTIAYGSESTTVEKIKKVTVTTRPLTARNVETTTVRIPSTTKKSRAWNTAYIDKNWQEPTQKSTGNQSTPKKTTPKPPTRPRGYADRSRQTSTTPKSDDKSASFKTTKRQRTYNNKNSQDPARKFNKSDVTTQASVNLRNTSSYTSSLTADKSVQTSRRRSSRPRTATYRRHLEVSQPGNSLIGKKEVPSVAITPRYHASIKTENLTQQSVRKESAVSLELANKTDGNDTLNSTGISASSRGNSGNSDSNIFNPARATYLINSNASLLEQIRSTVAPLLSVLGAKTPVFAGVYRNVSSNETSAQRVTPSGSPPRFSARYRGVELFVRKPNDANSTGNASTTPLTSSSSPSSSSSSSSSSDEASSQVSVSSPGDPKVLTVYRALESVSINNEVDQATDEERQQQLNRVVQVVDSAIDKDSNISSNFNNDTTTETIATSINPVATTDSLTVVTDSPTLDTSTITQPDLTQIPEVNMSLPENTEMNQGPFDPQFVNNSSNDVTFTASNNETVENAVTDVIYILPSTEISESSSTDAISLSSSTQTNQVSSPEVGSTFSSTVIIENSSTIPTSTDNSSIDVTSMPPSTKSIESSTSDQNSITEMIITSVGTTTTEPEVITSTTQEASVTTETASIERKYSMTEPMDIVIARLDESTTSSVLESTTVSIESSSSTEVESTSSGASLSTSEMIISTESSTDSTEGLEILPQLEMMNQGTNAQNITESTVTTESSSETTVSVENTTEITSDSNLNITEEAITENTTDNTDIIDDTLLNEMMMRLMNVVSQNQNISQFENNSVKNISDDGAQLLGGFLDHTDRNSTLDLELNEESNETVDNTTSQNLMMDNMIESTPISVDNMTDLDNPSSDPSSNMNVGLESKELKTEIPDVEITLSYPSRPEITTSQDDLTNQVENMTLTPTTTEDPDSQSETSLNIDDTNTTTNATIEIITTTLESETLETTTDIGMLDTSVTTPSDSEITTNPSTSTLVPETTSITDNPNLLAGFQESTTATAQTTAGSQQATTQMTTETQFFFPNTPPTTLELPTSTEISSTTETLSSTSETPPSTTETPSSTTEIPSSTTETPSSTTEIPLSTTAIPSSTSEVPSSTSEAPLSTTESPSSTSEAPSSMTEFPSSTTEAPSSTTESPSSTPESTTLQSSTTEPSSSSSIPSSSSAQTTTSAAESTTMVSSTSEATTQSTSTTTASMTNPMQATTTSSPSTSTEYLGRFGGSRMTPAPRLSSSSSTRMPLRDYHVYGIYPNKTIVRKRPEDNLIDARNVDSPYVIFGIYPDGKLVRKFPNGTVIPDPPTNPVEVVFSLSTSTTTNRPRPILQYNQANQGTNNNQNFATFNNRPAGTMFAQPSGQPDGFRSQLDLGLSDNALSPDGDGPNQFGDPNLMSGIGTVGTQLSSTNMITDALSGGSRPPLGVTPSSVNPQGGRIIQDIERDKASRTKEAGGQRSTVYIGQEKFINYWTNDTTPNNSRVVSVEINSVASAINEGLPGSSLPSLDILPNNQVQGQVTAPPGFPWKDPLDQIFGITTESPIIRASVASNTLDEPSSSRSPITARPINRLSEVFTPMLNANQLARDTSITITNDAPAVSTTVGVSTTTPTTTTSTTTSTTNSRPTTTTTTTTFAPTMMTTTPLPTPTIAAPTTNTMSTSTTSLFTTMDIPKPTSFGRTFDDLAFLNTLLESDYRPNSISSTPKTLTEVERLLANKILSLALSQPGPTRSPKAIQPSNASPNSLDTLPASFGHSSMPIIIDLLQSTSKKPVATTTTTEPFTWKPVTDVTSTTSSKSTEITTQTTTTITSTTTTSTMTPPVSQVTFNSFPTHPPTFKPFNDAFLLNTVPSTAAIIPNFPSSTSTTIKPTTRKPVSSRPTSLPVTTQAPPGFGANLLQAIFGRNIFAPLVTSTERSVNNKPLQTTKKVVQTMSKPVQTTPKPYSTTAEREMYAASEQIDQIDFSNSLISNDKATTPKQKSKYSPEEDAKFLLELLSAADKAKKEGKKESLGLSDDDEAFLRTILNGQAKAKIPVATAEDPASKNAALLAELLKAQGIEPSTPPNRLREQLQGISVTSTTTIKPKIVSTTPKRPATSRPRPTVRTPSSTYPPPLFSNFNFGLPQAGNSQQNSEGGVRNQVLTAAIGATRLFSQFLGAAITGAAQQLQSFVRNSTRYVSEAVG